MSWIVSGIINKREVNVLKMKPSIWIRIASSLAVILINLLALPIAIYLLFAFDSGSIISNADITLSSGFLVACNILSVQLLIANRNRPKQYHYAGLALVLLQLISCLLYMNLFTLTAYMLFAATIILSSILLVKTIQNKDPALI